MLGDAESPLSSAHLKFVIPSGFEPETYCLEGSCSIQLSYGTCCGQQKTPFYRGCCRGGRIRTYDLLLPKQARYRATLHPEFLGGEGGIRTPGTIAGTAV